jgi:hypothetical protein
MSELDTLTQSGRATYHADDLAPAQVLVNPHDLPAGVHPHDARGGAPGGREGLGGEGPTPQGKSLHKPWDVDNEEAFSVYQRASHDWSAQQYNLTTGNTPFQLAGRQKGRESVTIWVPSTASFGCIIAPSEGDVQQGTGIVLNVGDSITLRTEGPVYTSVISPNATGTVYIVQFFNPPGGGLGLSAG